MRKAPGSTISILIPNVWSSWESDSWTASMANLLAEYDARPGLAMNLVAIWRFHSSGLRVRHALECAAMGRGPQC